MLAAGASVVPVPVPQRKLQELGKFDGSSSWEAYKIQFDMPSHLKR